AENQGKIGADDTEVVKGSGDTEAVNTAGEGVSTTSVPETVSIVAPSEGPGIKLNGSLQPIKDDSQDV
ncbi:hypothetical protein Tco_1371645, partial [Tanacetum coccineum]